MQLNLQENRVDSKNAGSYNTDSSMKTRNVPAATSTGEQITVRSISPKLSENGKVMLNTSAGTVELDRVSFADPYVQTLYQYAAGWYNASVQNAFIGGYENAKRYNGELSITDYKDVFDRIAESSLQGMQEESLRQQYAGEIGQIGDVAFVYAQSAGQMAKNNGERGIYVRKETRYGQNNRDRAGSLRPSGGLGTQTDVGRGTRAIYSKPERVQRTSEENDARRKNSGGQKSLRRVGSGEYSYTETGERAKTARSKALQSEFAELGIDSTVIDGKAEVVRNGRKTILGGEAATIADGSVLVRNDGKSTAPTRRISGHELFHVAERNNKSQGFRNTIADGGVNSHSTFFDRIHDAIVSVYGEEFSAFENSDKFYKEFCAFVSGDIFEHGGRMEHSYFTPAIMREITKLLWIIGFTSPGRDDNGNIGLYKITVEEAYHDAKHTNDKAFHNLTYIEKVASVGGRTAGQGLHGVSTSDRIATTYTVSQLYSLVNRFDKVLLRAGRRGKCDLRPAPVAGRYPQPPKSRFCKRPILACRRDRLCFDWQGRVCFYCLF